MWIFRVYILFPRSTSNSLKNSIMAQENSLFGAPVYKMKNNLVLHMHTHVCVCTHTHTPLPLQIIQ